MRAILSRVPFSVGLLLTLATACGQGATQTSETPAPKPAVPASAPRNPQNTQGATPPRKENPAGQPAGGEKRGAAEKQKQDEKQKEHEKEKERGER